MTNKTVYTAGETATITAKAEGFASASVLIGSTSYPMTIACGVACAKVQTTGMRGRVRFAIFAIDSAGDVSAIESGQFHVSTLVSQYRAVCDAIEETLKGVATNGKYSVTVGEISLTDKTFNEMVQALGYFRAKAEEEEDGAPSSGIVTTINTRFV